MARRRRSAGHGRRPRRSAGPTRSRRGDRRRGLASPRRLRRARSSCARARRARATRGSRSCSSRSTRCAPDALGGYGRARRGARRGSTASPREGVRFETAHAHNVVTLPSHANILSGRYPLAHGVRDNTGFRFPPDTPTLATSCASRGLAHGRLRERVRARLALRPRPRVRRLRRPPRRAASGAAFADAGAARDRGPWRAARRLARVRARADASSRSSTSTSRTSPTSRPSRFASRFAGSPTRARWRPPTPRSRRSSRRSSRARRRERTLVVLTSDHGESLGEHGEATHGIFAYEATLRVPLVLYAPGLFRPAVVRDAACATWTSCRRCSTRSGSRRPPGLPGRSLLPLSRAGTASRARRQLLRGARARRSTAAGRRSTACVAGGLKYIDLPLPELYDLRRRPARGANLVASRPQDVRAPARAARSACARATRRRGAGVEEEQATLERLRALGYVAPAAARRAGALRRGGRPQAPDRARRADARRVSTLYQRGRLRRRGRRLRRRSRARPDMPLAYLQLAYLERARGRLDAAIAAARRAVELRPARRRERGAPRRLPDRGRAARAEAVTLLEPYAKRAAPDLDVLTALGMAQARAGRAARRARHVRARRASPTPRTRWSS